MAEPKETEESLYQTRVGELVSARIFDSLDPS